MALGSVSAGEVKGNVSFTFGADSSIQIDEETGEPIVQEGDVRMFYSETHYWNGSTGAVEIPDFAFNDRAYIMVIVPDFDAPYEFISDIGEVAKVQSGVSFYHEDLVPFAMTTEGTLEYEPIGQATFWKWFLETKYTKGVVPTTNGKHVTTNQPVFGQAEFYYDVKCDIWSVKLTEDKARSLVTNLEAWVESHGSIDTINMVIQGGKTASITIPFKFKPDEDATDEEAGGPFPYKLVFRGVCDGELITTPVNYIFNGTIGTSAAGEAGVGVLTKGEYSLSFSGEGIIPSGDDKIDNETVVI